MADGSIVSCHCSIDFGDAVSSALVWFRRDLRDNDNTALSQALQRHDIVYCGFVFDEQILGPLRARNPHDRRVEFIWHALHELDAALRRRGGGLILRSGDAVDEIPALVAELGVSAVFANRDYEPAAIARDSEVAERLRSLTGAGLKLCKDQVIFERSEILTQTGKPYGVFTPYKRTWLKTLSAGDYAACTSDQGRFAVVAAGIPELANFGFAKTDLTHIGVATGMSGAAHLLDDFSNRIARYRDARDYPAVKGSSYLSAHLRFGTVSIREMVRRAVAHGALSGDAGAETWLSELIWRDFYQMILFHHPRVVSGCYQTALERVEWRDAPDDLSAWQTGHTGYPLVDAAMRQLLQSGYMHNRLRMVAASFLTKDLEVDWRLGEAWFAEKLLDFDLAANNGGWQWAASTGCDAQPWFRIFNPLTQSEKFDPQGKFIRRYVPELKAVSDKFIHQPSLMSEQQQQSCGVVIGRDYPPPIVDHASARVSTLARYRAAQTDEVVDAGIA